MQTVHFETALEKILSRDSRFEPEAYLFLKEALDYTVENESGQGRENSKHVSAKELLMGYREYALKEYGPMAATLLEEWGVRSCGDVGAMVFQLIEEGMFGKQDSDRPDDFKEYFTFEEAFVMPFLPQRGIAKPQHRA